MYQTNSRRFSIDNVNSTTVGHVNAEGDTALIRDYTVAAGEFAAHRAAATAISNGDFISVHLLSREQWPVADANCISNFAMGGIEPFQHFGFVMQNVDTGNSLRENVTTDFNRAQRRKLLKGQIHHFLNTAVIHIITESGARTPAHSKSWRETERASCVNFARSALECDASSHRFDHSGFGGAVDRVQTRVPIPTKFNVNSQKSSLRPLWNFGLELIWNQKFGIFGSKSAPRCPPPVLAFLPRPRHCQYNTFSFSWHAGRG